MARSTVELNAPDNIAPIKIDVLPASNVSDGMELDADAPSYDFYLVAIGTFLNYQRGDLITDPCAIQQVLDPIKGFPQLVRKIFLKGA